MVFPLPHRLAPESVGRRSIRYRVMLTDGSSFLYFRGFAAVFAENVPDVPTLTPPGMLSSHPYH
jgi:hypothetical protein